MARSRARLGVAPEAGVDPGEQSGVVAERTRQAVQSQRPLQIIGRDREGGPVGVVAVRSGGHVVLQADGAAQPARDLVRRAAGGPEERRGGQEGGRKCSYGWSPNS